MANNINNNRLSDGALDIILQANKNEQQQPQSPLVQLLATKVMQNGRIRAVISDGKTKCSQCVFMSEEIEQLYEQGNLEKYTVIRLDEFTIYSNPTTANKTIQGQPVILVHQLTIIKPGKFFSYKCYVLLIIDILLSGEDIDHKLELGENFCLSLSNSDLKNQQSTTTSNDNNNKNSLIEQQRQQLSTPFSSFSFPSISFKGFSTSIKIVLKILIKTTTKLILI